MSLLDRLKRVRETARDLGRNARQAVYDFAMDQPEIRKRVDMARTLIEEARANVEDRFDGLEDNLWEWIREMQAQAQRAQQQVNRARESDDHYRTLGIQPGAGIDAVKKAWRQKMRENHPDRFSNDPVAESRAQARAQEINRAYLELRILLTGQ
mgnify:CR=1 FL=1